MLAAAVYQFKRPVHWFKTGVLSGLASQLRFGFPERKLRIIAVTGTDGKTTTSTLLYHVLLTAGYKVGLISTVAAYIGNEAIDTGFHVTNPSPWQLRSVMSRMVKAGMTHVVLEVTSHGLHQYRTWGIKPYLAGLTNISHEHLDYHVTRSNYVAAKAELFAKAKTAVLNGDDDAYSQVRRRAVAKGTKIKTYHAADRLPSVISSAVTARFPERYNQTNARLVVAMAQALGVDNTALATGIKSFPGVPGRMQYIPNKQGLQIVVDFAHTPQALEAVLLALQKQQRQSSRPGRLIAIFGSAGLRDTAKRPMMTAIACQLADLVILTAEDPRTEDVWAIIRQMKEGAVGSLSKIVSIPDRYQAIQFGITEYARRGDVIGIFGKGHEQSMCFGTTEYPWSDVKAVEAVLEGDVA